MRILGALVVLAFMFGTVPAIVPLVIATVSISPGGQLTAGRPGSCLGVRHFDVDGDV